MRRPSKNVVVLVLAAFFAFGILCSTFATPALALSVTRCGEMPGGMGMAGCEHPHYLCGFDSGNNPVSHGVLSSTPSTDSLKNELGLALGAPSYLDVSGNLAASIGRRWKNLSLLEPEKFSIRLFTSILNL